MHVVPSIKRPEHGVNFMLEKEKQNIVTKRKLGKDFIH